MRPGATLLNFSRQEVVDNNAVKKALADKVISSYINDFPCEDFREFPQVISFPHLGASTRESQDNCADMVVAQLIEFLERGTVHNSVNFPEVDMPWAEGYRLAIVNQNIPNMVGQISTIIAKHDYNVVDLINKSRDEIAYTMIDLNREATEALLQELRQIAGVVRVRYLSA